MSKERRPQKAVALVRDTNFTAVGIFTDDGHSVLLTSEAAVEIAQKILSIKRNELAYLRPAHKMVH